MLLTVFAFIVFHSPICTPFFLFSISPSPALCRPKFRISEPETSGKSPPPRYMHSLTYLKESNVLALYGGRDDMASKGNIILSDLWVLKMYNLEWVKVNIGGSLTPLSRYNHTAFSHNSALWILGGMDQNWAP